jgi:flagellar secretion chaperone FliS
MHNYVDSIYKKTDIITADRGKLLVLLYEGAVGHLRNAKESAERNDIQNKCDSLNRAMDIIQELNCSLKIDEGGVIARNLRELYWFMEKNLLKAKIEKRSTKKIEEVITLLTDLCEAWRSILENPEVKTMRESDFLNQPGLSHGITV